MRGFGRLKADQVSLPSTQHHICLTKWTQGPASLATAKENNVECTIRNPLSEAQNQGWGLRVASICQCDSHTPDKEMFHSY